MQQLSSEINDFFTDNNSSLQTNPRVELVRTLSYQKFGDLNRIWLEVEDYNSSKIYGLVYKNIVAGIIIPQDGRALGLLNRDIKALMPYTSEMKKHRELHMGTVLSI